MLVEATQCCGSCGRSLAEIAGWSAMSDAERAAVVSALAVRMKAALAGRAFTG